VHTEVLEIKITIIVSEHGIFYTSWSDHLFEVFREFLESCGYCTILSFYYFWCFIVLLQWFYSYLNTCISCLSILRDTRPFGIPNLHIPCQDMGPHVSCITFLRDRSLIMGGGWWARKGGWLYNYFCLNWGRPQTEKYVTRGDPNFLILSYSFSKSK
jgi:hypothetical protein